MANNAKKDVKVEQEIKRKKIRMSRKVYIPIYIMILILIGIIVYIKINDLELNRLTFWGVIIFIILLIKYTEIYRFMHSYELRDQYVIHRKGIISEDIKRILLNQVSDVDLQQSVWQRIINYGTVGVHRFSDQASIELKNINNPTAFMKEMDEKLKAIGN